MHCALFTLSYLGKEKQANNLTSYVAGLTCGHDFDTWHRSQRLQFLQSEKEKEFSEFDAPGSDWSRTLSFHRDAWDEKSGSDIRVFMSPQLSTAVLLFGPKTQPHHLNGLSCCLCRHVYTLQRSRVDGLLVAFQCNPSEARAWGWSPQQQQPWVGLEGMSLLN